jgi:two-component system C4-dicarboxylate transport sensor histidine kinase DctB
VVEILGQYDIDVEFFKYTYAVSIINYFLDVARGVQKEGQCPAMNNFVVYASEHSITSEEVFFICSTAKRTVTQIALKRQSISDHDFEVIEEIQNIFDNNLSGILKLYSDRLLQKEALLLHQSKHASMGKMMEYITHQWKEPISLLTFSISKIEYKYNLGELSKESFDKEVNNVKSSIALINNTIGQFRDFFDNRQIKQSFELTQSIRDIYDVIEPLFTTNNIEVIEDCTDKIEISSYKNDFEQAILNILSNAKDVFTERAVENRQVKISVKLVANKSVQINICDNAGGIDENLLDTIFSSYVTTKEKGSGIGLHITQTIIQNHLKGTIIASNKENDIGFGACFTITLPLDS